MKNKMFILFAIIVMLSTITSPHYAADKKKCKLKSSKLQMKKFEKAMHEDIKEYTPWHNPSFESPEGISLGSYRGFIHFIESEENNYFIGFSFATALIGRFEISEKTPFVIVLDDNSEIILYPTESAEQSRFISRAEIVGCYKISEEQLAKIAKTNTNHFELYVVSQKELLDTFKDESGQYFRFNIKAKKYKEIIKQHADCIVNG